MVQATGETTAGRAAKASRAGRIFGSLKDALHAASRDDFPAPPPEETARPLAIAPPVAGPVEFRPAISAEEAARSARELPRTLPAVLIPEAPPRSPIVLEESPAPERRVVRAGRASVEPPTSEEESRTVLVRGRKAIERGRFERDPVVGFLIVVGGPGLGSYRPVYEGNNTVGRSASNRVALDFGDETISAEAQAYIRYDSTSRSFLLVPNLAKTNIVSVNDTRPTSALPLKAMDVITLGRTQVAFVPFCGDEFDWSEISET